jgi:hypothetical protein
MDELVYHWHTFIYSAERPEIVNKIYVTFNIIWMGHELSAVGWEYLRELCKPWWYTQLCPWHRTPTYISGF